MINEETPPNWHDLRAANQELEELARKGRVAREDWQRLYGMAERAVGTHSEFLEGILTRGRELGLVTR